MLSVDALVWRAYFRNCIHPCSLSKIVIDQAWASHSFKADIHSYCYWKLWSHTQKINHTESEQSQVSYCSLLCRSPAKQLHTKCFSTFSRLSYSTSARSLGCLGSQTIREISFTPRNLSSRQSQHEVCSQQDCRAHTLCSKGFMRLSITQKHVVRPCLWQRFTWVFLT